MGRYDQEPIESGSRLGNISFPSSKRDHMNLTVINPFSQEPVCELVYHEGKILEQKIQAAADASKQWRHVPLSQRSAHVRSGIDQFKSTASTIAKEVSLQMGKPLSQAEAEVRTCCQRAEYMLSIAEKTLAPDILPSSEDYHLRIE